MTDTEKIQAQISEMMSGAGAMMSVQTVGYIMRRLLQEEPEMSLGTAKIYLKTIANHAKDLSEAIEQWSYKGRFSEALFDHHYLQPGQDELGNIYADLKGALKLLDERYQEHFRLVSVMHLLSDVRKCAEMLMHELAQA